MINGKRLLPLLAALMAMTTMANTAPKAPPLYVPVAVYYLQGKPVNVIAYPEKMYDSLKECSEAEQKALVAIEQAGKIPEGGQILGACMPIPSTTGTPGIQT